MPQYHGVTIGLGVTLLTPTADGIASQAIVTDGNGTLSFATVGASSPLTLTAGSASEIPLTNKAASGQTADLQQWTDSSDNVMARVKSDGTLRAGAAYLKSAGSYFWEIGTEDSGYGAALKGVGSSGIEIRQKTELMQGAAFDGTCDLPQIPVIIDSVSTGGSYSDGNNDGFIKGMEGGAYASPNVARHAGNLVVKCFDGNNTGASTSDGGIGGHIRNIYGQGGAGIAGGADGADGYWQVESSAGTVAIKTDWSTTAGDTRFLIYDVDNATLERVTVGAADSGGTGYKVLRIAN